MKKILFIANSDRHIKLCHIPYIKLFHDNNYIVHVATNTDNDISYCDKKYNLKLKRNPFSIKNIFALIRTRKLIKKEKYDIIYSHTPIGGFLGRFSTIGLKNKPLNIYMAHGFHFYKNGPLLNWLFIYPIEKYLSRYTDILITMNQEDYDLALNKFHCNVYRIHGIGLDENRLVIKDNKLRKKLNLKNKFVITYIAEISKRKNQINFLKKLSKYHINRDIQFILVGDSNIRNFNKIVSKYKNVKYFDYTDNVADYINISDIMISPSIQEGLPQGLLEALYFNKFVIATNIRGTRDIINDSNGLLVNDLDELIKKIIEFRNNIPFIPNNNIDIYKIENVMKEFINIINQYLDIKLK